ncbi:adenosylcobinamide kinase /adenosylcobinamide-phosphate guanylyltransferase [Scopulibacillus darangshiensis]|uniref:Adenosylcobinamide kinase n=1 Tax=Scopulibacillus darangshiensis TaxID=442528 RepID=A0A4R2PBH3_9BACL|nr:bifunctional adenosylcobinamide kinase/adenosylcobinamide-phosphate guanylyltransferase [Scopulibacillus darangshiensis]TCP31255.1 adenosylcobinamide kinase /adenosylcobinamide-phosphate guanylyltransferase [Scopulibacillus darangshiensis]
MIIILIFVTGGVRSGKSSFSEKLAVQTAPDSDHLHLIATSENNDKEMADRIRHHRELRQYSGVEWQTWEQPRALNELANRFNSDDVILLDCLTTWLSNQLFDPGLDETEWKREAFQKDVYTDILDSIKAIEENGSMLIIVSNELFFDPPANHHGVTVYLRLLGLLHQQLVSICDQAFLIENGCPVKMKG